MKTHTSVSSSRRKSRKAHFSAPSHIRYTLMSASLSKDLRAKHNIRSLPIRRDDEVLIVRGAKKGEKGKVSQVYRKKFAIYIEKVNGKRKNGAPTRIPIQASNVVLTKLKLTPDRQDLIRRKTEGKGPQNKGKVSAKEVQQKKEESK